MAGKWISLRGKAPGVGIAVLCAFGLPFEARLAGAAEPVVVINAQPLSAVPAEAQPVVEAIGVPAAPSAPAAAAMSSAPPHDPNFEPWPSVAAAPASSIETAAAEPPASAGPEAVAPPSPVVTLPSLPKAGPVWEKQPEFFTRPGITAITRYNRKSTRATGDDTAPIVAAATAKANDPRFNVIECVAGCKGPKGTIVYYAARLSSQTGLPVETAAVKPAVMAPPPPSDPAVIACVAGCYSTPKSYIARYPVAKAQAGPAGLVPVSAPVSALVPTVASMQDAAPVPVKAKVRLVPKRLATHRIRKPRAWQATVLAPPDQRLPYRTWRTNIRY